MVGVPGKSKGCSTCRRRKKGCDQKRPTCGQCVSSGYVCGGYQRELSFVIHPASKTAEKAFFVRQSVRTPNLAFMPSLDRAAVDLQCRALFWDLYLPHGVAEATDAMLVKCNQVPNWTSILLELSQAEPSLDLAFSALSIARVGHSNNDLRLVKESTKIYGRALKDLQRALNDELRMTSVEVLAACSLLGLYEVFEGGDSMDRSVGWVSHAAGAARLIELRGPQEHTERLPHHLFLGARFPILYSAILRRKKTFLAEADWLSVPWQTMPCKTYFDRLIDLAVKTPKLLEDFDNLRSNTSSDTHMALKELMRSFVDLKDELTRWDHGKTQASRPVLIPHTAMKDDTYPFDQEMSWKNHLFFNASLVYWSIQHVLSTSINQLELLLSCLGFPKDNLYTTTTSNQQHARQYVTCIAQSVPYALMPAMGSLGINYLAFPLCLSFQHFTQSNERQICAWLIEVCDRIRRQGVRVRPFDDSLIDGCHEEQGKSHLNGGATNDPLTDGAQVRTPTGDDTFGSSFQSVAETCGFRSTFIYENPAKYYMDSPKSEEV